MEGELVSVIIATYNRFPYLLNAINSVKSQTYKNIEIIVVNDNSSEEAYYTFDFKKRFGDNFYIVHLPRNSKDIYGFPVPGGHQRNIGMNLAKGKFIAFLDDDDIFLPSKIEKQIIAMKKTACLISCTEGYIGNGVYDADKKYNIYHYTGHYWGALKNIFKNKGDMLENMFKDQINIWNEEIVKHHNCCICSSIMISKDIIKKCGYFPIRNTADDYAYWLEIIKITNLVYLREPLMYFDNGHGSGRNYN